MLKVILKTTHTIYSSKYLWSNIFIMKKPQLFCHDNNLQQPFDNSKSCNNNESYRSQKFMNTEIWSYTVYKRMSKHIHYVYSTLSTCRTCIFSENISSSGDAKRAQNSINGSCMRRLSEIASNNSSGYSENSSCVMYVYNWAQQMTKYTIC